MRTKRWEMGSTSNAVTASVEVKFQVRSIKQNEKDSMLIKGLVNQ